MKGTVIRSYLLFGLRTLLPFAILPILSHRLGAASLGVVLAAQSLGLLGSIIVQYGFHVSASRELGLARDADAIDTAVGRVLSAQLLTSLVAAALVILGVVVTPALPASAAIFSGTVCVALGVGLGPSWYFRGTGRTPTGIGLDLAGQVVTFIAILLFVSGENDTGLAVLLIGLGPILGTMIGLTWLFRERRRFLRPRLAETFGRLSSGFALFVSRVSSTGFTLSATWLVSLLTTPVQAAYFGVAAKVVTALSIMSQPVLFALLPEASRRARESDTALYRLVARWGGALVALGVFSAIGVQIFADLFIDLLFAPDMAEAAGVMRFLAWICIVAALRDTLCDLVLVPFHQDAAVAKSVIAGGIVAILAALALTPTFGAYGMGTARILGEITITVVATAYLLRRRRG